MPDYQLGKIYKLYSNQQNITYIGSTAMYYLSQRLAKHISTYKQYLKNKASCSTSFKILECEDYKIELLEDYPCANRNQLEKREGYYIKNNECVNKVIPGRTDAEYREDNKEHIKERTNQYLTKNKDKIKEKKQKWYHDNKERVLEQKQEYNIKNKEHKKEYDKEYRTNNKDKINANASEKITCECGCQVRRDYLAKHFKTKNHIRLMDLVQNN